MRGVRGVLVLALGAVLAAAPAEAQVSGWDGTNPFDCVLQRAGTGTDFPDPGADPFCVEFEKRHQNVTQLGVVEFLAQEPARVAAASPKCFYFQHDHWRGSVAQENATTKTYEWDGSYFFDKALGNGGTYVENFSFGGQSGDPTQLPGFPEAWRPYFSRGRGGIQTAGSVAKDPRCVDAAAKRDPRVQPGQESRRCRIPGGRVHRGIGGIRLGMRRVAVKRALGPPHSEGLGYLTWCLEGGAKLVAAFRSDSDTARVRLVLTNAPEFDTRRVRVGLRSRTARRRLRGERRFGRGMLSLRVRRQRLLFGLAKRRVSFLAVARPRLPRRTARGYVKRAP
jgi:hypothetical protein